MSPQRTKEKDMCRNRTQTGFKSPDRVLKPETQRDGEAAILELVGQGRYRRPLAEWPQRPKQRAGQSPAKSKSEGNGCPNYVLPGLTGTLTTRVLSPISKEFWSLKKTVRKLSEIFGHDL